MKKRPVPTEELLFAADHLNNRGQFLADRADATPARCYAAAPQDRALCMIGGKKRGARQAWLRQVLSPGPDRCEPVCPHFGFCGGCALQHINYRSQAALKAAPLEESLRALENQVKIFPVQEAPTPWYYRSKIELSFINDQLGFNIRGLFQKVVNVDECFIGPPCNREIIKIVRNWQKKYNFPGWNPKSNTGFLRYLVIRFSSYTGQFLIALITASPTEFSATSPENPLQELADELMGLDKAAGVVHVIHDDISPTASGETEYLLSGQAEIKEKVNDLEFSLGWRSFFQSNPPAYAKMLRTARLWAGCQEKILDLYCGVGSIGLSLDGNLIGVESVPQAIEHAKRNAQKLGRQAEFYCANSEDWPSLECSLLILDPPRSGCHPKMIERVVKEGPETLLYISCNCSRFIEEYNVLRQAYRLVQAQLYDFFPHTPHIETLMLLKKR
ncbi:MAG: 23S rRNA (uracil(1939)-C(5))-methyltransferase RlmD [Candidatus Bruticola sp.]